MLQTITMPQLGETVTEGTVAQWLKRPGDAVEKYEAFVEVSTDKVNAEVPSPFSGVLHQIIAQEGETVPIGAPIAIIDDVAAATGEAVASPVATPAPNAAETALRREADRQGADEPVPGQTFGVPTAMPAAAAPAASNGASGNGTSSHGGNGVRRVSPAVRRLAREHHIDVGRLRGTGTNGRVTASDVLAAAQQGPAAVMGATIMSGPVTAPPPATPRPPSAAPAAARPSYASPVPGETIPLTQARKIIAQRMVESKHTAPHAWTMVEVDVTRAWAWRKAEKDRFAREQGYPLTLLPFFIHASVQALKAYPLMNARFTEDGILVHRDIHVGIAVALDSNLIVPVIRNADHLSIAGIAVAAGRLIEKARAGKLSPDDLTGGTFTVNNTGANGSVLSAPILNGGQAGIVTMEAVVKRAIVTADDAIAVRSMMNVCLSLDHRVVDGAIASAFLVELKKRLEAMKPGDAL